MGLFIIGFLIGIVSGITIMCLVQVCKEKE